MKTKTVARTQVTVPSQYFAAASCGATLIENGEGIQAADLQWYFDELYQSFLYQFARLVHEPIISEADEHKMESMLKELTKVKRLIASAALH